MRRFRRDRPARGPGVPLPCPLANALPPAIL